MGQSTVSFRILLISCIALYFFEKASGDPSVIIGKTQIIGQLVYASDSVANQYLAVPYAEPPVRELRFKKPIPPKNLPKLYVAFNPPPACFQRSEYPFPWYDASSTKSEDCLYLNIWTPQDASPTNKKAVVYFIHDGGFRFGSISQNIYNGAAAASRGDVVVVTVNHRLGSFGFLTSGTEDAPGNVGLYDMLEGLKWVNNHIEAFGGDPSRITLAGVGSGSTAVGILSTSPLSKGLFQRAIMGSGSPGYPDPGASKVNMAISQKVAERVFCANKTHTIQNNPSEVVKCLRNVEAGKLTDVSSAMHSLSSMLYIPQYGDDLVPMDPAKALQNGDLTCNDLLIGNTNDEGSYILTTHYPSVYGFFGNLNPQINKTVGQKEIKSILSQFKQSDAVVKQYLPDSLPDDAYDTIRKQVYTSLGDATIVCPLTFFAEQCASAGGDVYYYIWNHRSSDSVWDPWMGVAHASDIPFAFGLPLLHSFYYQPDEATLSGNVIDLWTSFAKNGKPNVPWSEFSKENPQVVVLGPGSTDVQTQSGFHRENCNFFRPYFGFQ